jgi:peptidoglycan/xylan/chitin deacetylase (PgdA/CDA1 family)
VIRGALARVLVAGGVPAYLRSRQAGRLAILMFHGVEPVPLSPPCWHVLDVATLRRELEWVRERFHVLPLEDALERLEAGTLPHPAAAITFDDGTQNVATQAEPVLAGLGLRAALFVATGPIGTSETLWPDRLWLAFAHATRLDADLSSVGLGTRRAATPAERGAVYALAMRRLKDLPDARRIEAAKAIAGSLGADVSVPGPFRMLSWDEVRALHARGTISVHPHSVTHPILSRCDDEKVEREIAESCDAIARVTGTPPRTFAYPNGRAQDFDRRAQDALRRRGVRWALSTIEGLAARRSDPLAIPRLAIGSDLSFARFRLLVSGLV